MGIKTCSVCITVILLITGGVASQATKADITVYTIYIPGLLTHEHTGPFVDLIKEIGRRADMRIGIEILPPMRQRTLFNKKKVDIIFPMVESSFDEGIEYLRSSSFYEKKYYAFTKKGGPSVKNEADLENLQSPIGLTLGYSYPKQLLNNSRLVFDYALSDDHNMLKLGHGRIAAFVVEELSGLYARRNTKLENVIEYDPDKPLFTEEVFFAFQKKERLSSAREAISRAIEQMKEDGSLKMILNDLQPIRKPIDRRVFCRNIKST